MSTKLEDLFRELYDQYSFKVTLLYGATHNEIKDSELEEMKNELALWQNKFSKALEEDSKVFDEICTEIGANRVLSNHEESKSWNAALGKAKEIVQKYKI